MIFRIQILGATGKLRSLPSSGSVASGLSDCDLTELGIPTAEDYFRMYCLHMGIPPIENWNFYMAFSFFRIAAILQGVYKRSLTGNGSLGELASGCESKPRGFSP